MRELFQQMVYGRSQTAFSANGLPIGAGMEDLGKALRSQVGTMYGTLEKGPRYLEMTEGYVRELALDAGNEIIGYKYTNLGKMMQAIERGYGSGPRPWNRPQALTAVLMKPSKQSIPRLK